MEVMAFFFFIFIFIVWGFGKEGGEGISVPYSVISNNRALGRVFGFPRGEGEGEGGGGFFLFVQLLN